MSIHNAFSAEQISSQYQAIEGVTLKRPIDKQPRFTTSDGRKLVVNRGGCLSTNWRARAWSWIRSLFGDTDQSDPVQLQYKLVKLYVNASHATTSGASAAPGGDIDARVLTVFHNVGFSDDFLGKAYKEGFDFYLNAYLKHHTNGAKEEMEHIISLFALGENTQQPLSEISKKLQDEFQRHTNMKGFDSTQKKDSSVAYIVSRQTK